MWKTAILPAVLPDRLGTSRDNDYVRKFAHKKPAAKPAQVTARRASKRLIWVYRNKFSAVASTVLRGHQLAALAKQRLAGKVEIGIVNETCLAEQRDSILPPMSTPRVWSTWFHTMPTRGSTASRARTATATSAISARS